MIVVVVVVVVVVVMAVMGVMVLGHSREMLKTQSANQETFLHIFILLFLFSSMLYTFLF